MPRFFGALVVFIAIAGVACSTDNPSGATATATPVPTPTPEPTPTPIAQCTLPAMPECGGPESSKGVFGCCREEEVEVFVDQVAQAQTAVRALHPELFSGSRVVNDHNYAERVAEQLREMGLCAATGPPEDEVAVKDVNDFSEQYDIVLGSTQEPWTAHAVTCRPARF